MSMIRVQNQNKIKNYDINRNNSSSNEVEFKEELEKAEVTFINKDDTTDDNKKRKSFLQYESVEKYEYKENNSTSGDVTITAMKARIELVIQNQVQMQQLNKQKYEDNLKSLKENPLVELSNQTGLKIPQIYDIMQSKVVDSNNIEAPIAEYINPLNEVKEGENIVSFVDDFTNQDVYIELNDNNKKSIEKKFGDINSDEAKEFVKSWYNEASYSVGYLQSDTNSDGVISDDEAKSLNMLLVVDKNGKLEKNTNLNDYFNGDNDKINNFISSNGYINNINDFINQSMSDDKNFDGKLSFKEVAKEKVYEYIKASNTQEEQSIENGDDKNSLENIKSVNVLNIKNNNYYLVDKILEEL